MFELWLGPLLRGFSLGAGLISAIGAQNVFILRQGLKRQHIFAVATISFACDTVLTIIGAVGFGTLISKVPLLTVAAAWGSAAFLLFYGLRSFKSAFSPTTLDIDKVNAKSKSRRSVILTALALSLLNPHVYIDTVVLVGSVAAQYLPSQRIFFIVGAVISSFIWFFGLAYGAVRLTPLFQQPVAWRVLDAIVGCIMWVIAVSLSFAALNHLL